MHGMRVYFRLRGNVLFLKSLSRVCFVGGWAPRLLFRSPELVEVLVMIR